MRQEIDRAPTGTAEDTRLLSIRFESFGWRAVQDAAAGTDSSTEELIASACGHLLVALDKGRPAARRPATSIASTGEEREFEVSLPPRLWDSLDAEAERQGAELHRLIEHAVLLYVSDLDAGRATNAILDELAGD